MLLEAEHPSIFLTMFDNRANTLSVITVSPSLQLLFICCFHPSQALKTSLKTNMVGVAVTNLGCQDDAVDLASTIRPDNDLAAGLIRD
jgi:hypothetical protein